MDITGIISAIIVGLIVGALRRLIVPGRQAMGILLTIVLGIVGALVGGYVGAALGGGALLVFILQVAVAALLVFLVAGMRGRTTRV